MSQFYILNKDAKITVKNAQLYQENGNWYMTVTYIVENEKEITELYIPKIEIPIGRPRIINPDSSYLPAPSLKFVMGNAYFDVFDYYDEETKGTYLYRTTLIKEKRVPMTLSEIEKKLGHKILIVSEHEEKEK